MIKRVLHCTVCDRFGADLVPVVETPNMLCTDNPMPPGWMTITVATTVKARTPAMDHADDLHTLVGSTDGVARQILERGIKMMAADMEARRPSVVVQLYACDECQEDPQRIMDKIRALAVEQSGALPVVLTAPSP